MKRWHVFLLGAATGVALNLGVTRVVSSRADETSGPVVGTSEVLAKGNAPKSEADAAAVEDAIKSVTAWAGSRSARPSMPDLTKKLRIWAGHDPSAARAFVMGTGRFPDRMTAMGVVLAVLAREQPEEVANWVRENLPKPEWGELAMTMFVEMGEGAPEQWLEFALSFPGREGGEVRRGFGRMLANLVKKSPTAAVSFYERLGDDDGGEAAERMLSAWAERDEAGAIAWARQRSEVRAMPGVWVQFLEDCAASRPDLVLDVLRDAQDRDRELNDFGAAAVARRLLDVARLQGEQALALISAKAAQSAVRDWAERGLESDPEGTLALLNRWVPQDAQAEAIRDGFKNWLRSDQQGAHAWATAVTDPHLRTLLQAGEFSWRAKFDPEGALRGLEGRAELPAEISDAAQNAFVDWSFSDAPAAAEWTLRNPQLVSAHQIGVLVESWMSMDEVAAVTWLAKLPGGPLREAALQTATSSWVKRNQFDLAAQVIASISDRERRQKMIFHVYRELSRGPNSQMVERWLDTQEVDEGTKASWRREGGPE